MAFDACQPFAGIAEAGDHLVEFALSDTCVLFEIGRQLFGLLFDQLTAFLGRLFELRLELLGRLFELRLE